MRLPSYRKHASGQARVTLAGRDYLLGPFGSKASKNKYNRLVAEYLASGQSKTFGVAPDELTIAILLASYMAHAKKYYGIQPESEFHRLKTPAKALRALYGTEPVTSFGPQQFKAVREHLAKEGDRSREYINVMMKRIRRIFIWASGEGLVPASIPDALGNVDPLKAGRTNLREASPITTVPEELVDATLPHLPQVVADMVRLQRLTGCRPGEVCKITPSMIDRTTGDIWELKLEKHKTAYRGKERFIPLGKRSQAILAPYLLRGEDEHCFKPSDSEKRRREAVHDARVTPLSQGNSPGSKRKRAKRAGTYQKPVRVPGESYTAASYGKAVTRACDKAFPAPKGTKGEALKAWQSKHHWHPNQLRHNYATNVRKSDGVEAASTMLGHSEIGVTQIYAEADKEKMIEIARRIG